MAAAQAKLFSTGVKKTQAEMSRQYQKAAKKIMGQFVETHNKVMLGINEGIKPTPADLYKLDKYWQMQGQLQQELTKLGNKQLALFHNMFTNYYIDVYEELALIDRRGHFSAIDKKAVEQVIAQIWCADGQTWSNRIWTNIGKLQEELNNGLLECVVTGKSSADLKNILQERFNVSYNRADSIVRTELAHVQTQAAKQRYQDIGVTEVEILADEDERRCPICAKNHGKRYPINAEVPVPTHPRCRCAIIPVVE
jgi:SPP1 gp7 family putative phage head morphogenesis protein